MMAAAGTSRRRGRALLAVLVATLTLGALVASPPAGAAKSKKKQEVKVSDARMTWAVSSYVLTPGFASLSVSEVHDAEAPATFTDGTGWTFTEGTGTYDKKSGATTISFPGALEFGNTSRGNYSIKLADPVLELDGDGNGTLTADVSVRQPGAAAFDPAAKVAVVDITGASLTKSKGQVEVTATPTAFSAAFITAVGELGAHFQPTGSSNDANKPPAPITVDFTAKAKKAKSS